MEFYSVFAAINRWAEEWWTTSLSRLRANGDPDDTWWAKVRAASSSDSADRVVCFVEGKGWSKMSSMTSRSAGGTPREGEQPLGLAGRHA